MNYDKGILLQLVVHNKNFVWQVIYIIMFEEQQKTEMLPSDRYVILDVPDQKQKMNSFHQIYDKQNKEYLSSKTINHDYLFNEKTRQERKQIYEIEDKFNLLMKQCQSQYICSIRQSFTNQSRSLYILDKISDSSLDEEIFVRESFTEIQALIILKQIVSGLKVIASHEIICMYLNMRMLRFWEGAYKIGSYQFTKRDFEDQVLQLCKAPEIRNGESYNEKVDVWSLGVILFMMIYPVPYNKKTYHLQQYLKDKETLPKNLSLKTKILLSKMIEVNIESRVPLIELQKLNDEAIQNLMRDESYKLPQRLLIIPQKQTKQIQVSLIQENDRTMEISTELMMKKINSSEKEVLKKERKNEYYEKKNSLYLEILKSEFLFRVLLHNGNIIVKKFDLEVYEVFFLIGSRIFINLSNFLQQVENLYKELEESEKNKLELESIKKLIKPLKKKVDSFYSEIEKKLYQKESKNLQIVKRRFNLLFNDSDLIKKKQNFLGGIEGCDYKKNEQILFTQETLMKKNLYKTIYEKHIQHLTAKNYVRINHIQVNQFSGLEFEKFVQKVLKNQQ